jgi:hypothetical protein
VNIIENIGVKNIVTIYNKYSIPSQYEKARKEESIIITDICFKNDYDNEDGNDISNFDSDSFALQEAKYSSRDLSIELHDKVIVKRLSNLENKIIHTRTTQWKSMDDEEIPQSNSVPTARGLNVTKTLKQTRAQR